MKIGMLFQFMNRNAESSIVRRYNDANYATFRVKFNFFENASWPIQIIDGKLASVQQPLRMCDGRTNVRLTITQR